MQMALHHHTMKVQPGKTVGRLLQPVPRETAFLKSESIYCGKLCCQFSYVAYLGCFKVGKSDSFQRMYFLHLIIIAWIYSSFSGVKFQGDTAHYQCAWRIQLCCQYYYKIVIGQLTSRYHCKFYHLISVEIRFRFQSVKTTRNIR